MTHVFALAHLQGRPGAGELVDAGLAALRPGGLLHDDEAGGWFTAVAVAEGSPPDPGAPDLTAPGSDTTKAAYPTAFVVLAAASAVVAGRPGAREVLEEALAVHEEHFWDDAAGLVVEEWDRRWTVLDPYRGVNANMHTVEALLTAADATGQSRWRERAARITERVVHGFAREGRWRLVEHYDADWSPLPDHHRDTPADPFRPYGVTVGHLLEWARLCLSLRVALGTSAPSWLLADAVALFDRAVGDGWHADGADGFVYTTDFDGRPVVRARMHWVLAEAVGAAAALFQATGAQRYADLHAQWWQYAEAHLLDRRLGSWHHELDEHHRPASTTWTGKPDVYHAVQATLVPRLPLAPTFAAALRSTALRSTALGSGAPAQAD